ncbi:hypothetical protein [Streptomyces poriticola]|uniref:hypothetical protein n=1 Tax=Streptomyces poriticola TaxID=3120506 RepID=UPI002FCDE793
MSGLREEPATRVTVADGARGTLLQAQVPIPVGGARRGRRLCPAGFFRAERSTDAIAVQPPEAGCFNVGGRP